MQPSTWKILGIFFPFKFILLCQERTRNSQVSLSTDKQTNVLTVQNPPLVLLLPWNTIAVEVYVGNCAKTAPLNVLIRICQACFDWKQFMTQWTYFFALKGY